MRSTLPLCREFVKPKHWCFNGEESKGDIDRLQSTIECSTKPGHLIALLPGEALPFVGFQEIRGGQDVAALAHSASPRDGRQCQALSARGKDTSTGQNVGTILETSSGWEVYGQPSLASDWECDLSRHLVLRLTNAVFHLHSLEKGPKTATVT
jgi:hypothetical protein